MKYKKIYIFTLIMGLYALPVNAELASQGYVDSIVDAVKNIQSDWNQSDSSAPDYIKNKPVIPDISNLENVENKLTSLDAVSNAQQYYNAQTVKNALDTKLDKSDPALDSVPMTMPSGDAPEGRAFIWVN